MEPLPGRCVVLGPAERCLHAAELWRRTHGETETFTADQATAAVAATAPRLFGATPGIVALDAQNWNTRVLDELAASDAPYMLCVSPAKKPTAAQRRSWQARGEVIDADDAWRDAAITALFAEAGVQLERGARRLIAELGIDVGRARSMSFSARHAGIEVLDERKAAILLGGGEGSLTLFQAVDRCLDDRVVPNNAELDGIEAVVLAGQLAEALRGVLCVIESGATGANAATVAGTAPFTARALNRRAKALRAVAEAGFEAACDADVAARTEALTARDVAGRVVAALCRTPGR